MKRTTRSLKTVLAAMSLILLALPAFAPSAGAADPVPPFSECPAAGKAPSCNVLIVFNANGTVGIFQGQPTRIDDDEDTLVGVRNSSGQTIPNAILSSTNVNIHPFAFDGDGMCSTAPRSAPRPAGCPYQTTGTGADYAGPGITYTAINQAKTSGTVNFAKSCTQTTNCTSTPNGLTTGSTVFFSLEDKVDAGNIVVDGKLTAKKSASPNPAKVGDVVTYTIKLSNAGSTARATDVIDDYDEAHISNITNISNSGVNNSPSAGKIKWTAISVPPGTDTVTLSYKGTVGGTFSGSHGDCGEGFPVINTVTLSATNSSGTSNTLCVTPIPPITSVKSASPGPYFVGDTVTYSIKLSNLGTAAQTTDVVDDYDEAHVGPITDISNSGVDAGGKITWTAVSVPPGTNTVTLSYKGKLKGPLSGSHGTCGTDKWPVTNNVTLSKGTGTSLTLCVGVKPIVMTGRAFGASLSLLGSELLAPTADTGPVATEGNSFTDECFLPLPIPSDPGYIINIRVLCGTVTTTAATHTSLAEATVAHVTVVIPGLPIIDIGVIESNSTTTCAGSVGHTNILSLKLDGVEQLPFEDAFAANTIIPLGIGELRINEQIPFPAGPAKGLTVNAVHLDLPGIIDLVLASSESDVENCP